MRIYSEPLPTGFRHDGKIYVIDTDFKVWSKFEGLITDNDIAPDIKQSAISELIFPDAKPPRLDDAVMRWLIWFYRCGEPERKSGGRNVRAYSLGYDEGFIFAAFYQNYGIDLETADMHWWKFEALFRGLKDTKFNDICGYRTADIGKDTPKARAEFLREMQDFYELPETMTDSINRERARRFYG